MNANSLAAIRFLVDNKLKLLKVTDIKVKIVDFKKENNLADEMKVHDLDGKELSDDGTLDGIFAGRTNVDMNSCMIKIYTPTTENK